MTNKQLAAAARRAARNIERDHENFGYHLLSCPELGLAISQICNESSYSAATQRYAKFYGRTRPCIWFGDCYKTVNADHRVIALCFFAAAVETGDA